MSQTIPILFFKPCVHPNACLVSEIRHCTTPDGILPKRHYKMSDFTSTFSVTNPAFSLNVELSVSQKSDVCSIVEFRYQH
jgi:hypothetical protein